MVLGLGACRWVPVQCQLSSLRPTFLKHLWGTRQCGRQLEYEDGCYHQEKDRQTHISVSCRVAGCEEGRRVREGRAQVRGQYKTDGAKYRKKS